MRALQEGRPYSDGEAGQLSPGVHRDGHTRWATHGEPNDINAHLHMDRRKVAVGHNGVIENYSELERTGERCHLPVRPYRGIVHLVEEQYDGILSGQRDLPSQGMLSAIAKTPEIVARDASSLARYRDSEVLRPI